MKLNGLVFGTLAFVCVEPVSSAPDPNIFDGRYSVSTSASSDNGNGGDGKVESDSNGGSGSATGEVNQNSETTASEAVNGHATSDKAQATGAGQSTGEHPYAGSASSSTESIRKFDEFEIGAIGEIQPLSETNTSKKPLESPTSTRKVTQTSNSQVNNTDQKESANSEPQETYNEDGRADYGTDVPSGL